MLIFCNNPKAKSYWIFVKRNQGDDNFWVGLQKHSIVIVVELLV